MFVMSSRQSKYSNQAPRPSQSSGSWPKSPVKASTGKVGSGKAPRNIEHDCDDDEDGIEEDEDEEVRGGDGNDYKSRGNSWKLLIKRLENVKNATSTFGKQAPLGKKSAEEVNLLQCIHFAECAGCTQQNNFTNTPIMQRAQQFMKTMNVPFQVQMGPYHQWRTLVKLAVQPMSKWGGLRFGLYKAGTHDIVSIPQCRVHHPKINEAAEFVRLSALDAGVTGYVPPSARQRSSGDLRYLQFSASRATGKVQLVLVWNAENYKDCSASIQRLVKRLKSRGNDLFHSIHVNFHTQNNNNIFDYEEKNWKLLWGPQVMKETVGKGIFTFLPQVFKQSNIDFFEKSIIPFVSKHIPLNSTVAELYAGIGIIGLNIADRADEVLLSDSNPFVEKVFDECAESFSGDVQGKVFYDCLDADSAIENGQCDEADVIIVDPPRKGLNEGVLRFLTGKHEAKKLDKQRRLVYVGCGYESVERDTKDLIASGKWKIKAAEGFALFPGSDHIETVIVFDRLK